MDIFLVAPPDENQWPSIWKECYNIWKNSPYNINLISDEELDSYIKKDDPEFFETLKEVPKIYKIDYVRYLLLANYGGACFDMDIEILRDFLPMVNPNKIYLKENPFGVGVENSIMISTGESNADFFKAMMLYAKDKITRNLSKAKQPFNVVELVGPLALTDHTLKYMLQHPGKIEVLSHHHFGSLTNEISFTRHHYTNTWHHHTA